MSHPASASEELDRAVARVRAATRLLQRAAEAGDTEAIEQALEARGEAVERLAQEVATRGVTVDGATRGRIATELALEAGEVEATLERLVEGSRTEIETLLRGSRAVRGYARTEIDPSALDRSG